MTVEQALVTLIRERDGQDFDGEVRLTSAEASQIISALSREGGLIDGGYAKAMRDASKLTQEMCHAIGAAEGSSIHSALSACWEKMDEIAQGTEARRAETGTGSVHDGPLGSAYAPAPSPTTNKGGTERG